MDFLKISTNMFEDPKIKVLRKKYGRDGYFVYQHTLYLIAQSITSKNTSCELPCAADAISFDLGMERADVEEMLATCIELKLLDGDEKNTVSCLKILSRLDMNTVSKEMRRMILKARERTGNIDSKTDYEAIESHEKPLSEVEQSDNATVDKDKEKEKEKERENFSPLSEPQHNYARAIFDVWSEAGLPCCDGNYLSFLQRDFKLALPHLKGLHSDDVIQAAKNYAAVMKDKDTDDFWLKQQRAFDFFCSGKLLRQFLPVNFNAEMYKRKMTKAEKEKLKQEAEERKRKERVEAQYEGAPCKCPYCGEKVLRYSGSITPTVACYKCFVWWERISDEEWAEYKKGG